MRAKKVFGEVKENSGQLEELLYSAKQKYGQPLEKGEYIGACTAHDCDKNAYKHRKKYPVYKGVMIFYDPVYGKYRKVDHIFNVNKNEEVVEFTDLRMGPLTGEETFYAEDRYYFGKLFNGRLKDVWREN